MAAMLGVASGRVVRSLEIQVAKATNVQKNGSAEESILTGIRNLIDIARFSSLAELSGDIVIRKVSQNQGKQKNIRESEEFELTSSRDIEVQLCLNSQVLY